MDLDNLQTFYGLFSQYRFHIPDYQRGYSWEEGQWKALMDDLSTLTDDNDHFTGLLVLHQSTNPDLKVKIKGVPVEVFDLVDGQQRLTTIVILLNELRKEMDTCGSEDLSGIAERIVSTYLYEAGPGTTLIPKLVLDRNNYGFFKHNILKIDGPNIQGTEIQSHKNLMGAQAYFCNYLARKKAGLGEDYPAWLEKLYEKIANQMKVMVYKLRSEADAGVVFESMNNRGKKPNQLDLVKNYLLFLASKLGADLNHALTERINTTWEVIFKQLNAARRGSDEETLLQMHWLTVYDHDLKHWDQEHEKSELIKRRFSLLDYLDRYDELFQALDYYARTLMNAAVAYADLRMPLNRADAFQIYADDPDCRAQIIRFSEKLLRFGTLRPFQPFLIAVRMRYPQDAAIYLRAVQLCERYAFRVFGVAERRSSGKEAVLFRMANQLFNEKIAFESLEEDLRRDLLAECPDALFTASLSIENAVPWYGKRGLHYFLYEYEESLYAGKTPLINWQTIAEGRERSIEHILPQHPEAEGYWADHFSEEERLKLTHQVGNLTLVLPEVNSSLGRLSFTDKKGQPGQPGATYANSDLKITRLLAGLADWNPQELAKRQQRLADWALNRWQVDAPPPLPDEPWERNLSLAARNGVRDQFLRLRDLAEKLGLIPMGYRRSYAYASPANLIQSALTVRTYENIISVRVRPRNIPIHGKLTHEQIKEILGGEAEWWCDAARFEELCGRLEQLTEEMRGG